MPDRKSRTINIVGGGSAGWMTALYLNRYFNGAGENFVINVIESPDIGIIGVLSDRDDSDFWRSAPETLEHCPWLKAQLQLWSEKICEFQDFAGTFASIFSDLNYRYVLYGMQHYPRLGIQLDKKRGDALLGQFRAMADRAVANSLHHSDFLQFFARGPLRKDVVSVNV
ncbi:MULTISPECIES: tryptophan 7-halogenase [unclassified Microbulbifer]|uniref:tryptophan 7-halogenase n=1 Tax=unclassified Microbulbifer TaxID=2619833 RepID=UPI0027E545FA|nr:MULTISPECIES: tryptophan 7-halogenase [unclassified Microbulbifer]